MPVYEFRCRSCGTITEHLCRLEEQGEQLACPRCGGNVQKIFSLIQRPFRQASGSAAEGSSGSCSGGSCSTCHQFSPGKIK